MKRLILLIALLIPVSGNAGGLMMSSGTVVAAASGACDTVVQSETGALSLTPNLGDDAAHTYIYSRIIATETFDLCKLGAQLYKTGNGTTSTTIVAQIWSDSGLQPSSLLATSEPINRDDLTGYPGQLEYFTFSPSYTLTNAVTYHSVLKASLIDASNYAEWVTETTCVTTYVGFGDATPSWSLYTSARCGVYEWYK